MGAFGLQVPEALGNYISVNITVLVYHEYVEIITSTAIISGATNQRHWQERE